MHTMSRPLTSLTVIDGTLLVDHLAGSRAPFKSFFELDHLNNMAEGMREHRVRWT